MSSANIVIRLKRSWFPFLVLGSGYGSDSVVSRCYAPRSRYDTHLQNGLSRCFGNGCPAHIYGSSHQASIRDRPNGTRSMQGQPVAHIGPYCEIMLLEAEKGFPIMHTGFNVALLFRIDGRRVLPTCVDTPYLLSCKEHASLMCSGSNLAGLKPLDAEARLSIIPAWPSRSPGVLGRGPRAESPSELPLILVLIAVPAPGPAIYYVRPGCIDVSDWYRRCRVHENKHSV